MQKRNKSLKDEYILLSATLLFGIVANLLANFVFWLIGNDTYKIWVIGIVSFVFMILAVWIIQTKYKIIFGR